jgi:hypothetical protein
MSALSVAMSASGENVVASLSSRFACWQAKPAAMQPHKGMFADGNRSLCNLLGKVIARTDEGTKRSY